MGGNLQIEPKSTPSDTNEASLQYNYLVSMIMHDFYRFLAVAKMYANKMAEIEKEEVEYPVYYLVTKGTQHKVAAPYLIILLHTLFSCIKKILQSCRYVGLSNCSSPHD